MNDIIKPAETGVESDDTAAPRTLDLKTPEQKAAEQQAAKERAERLAAQAKNSSSGIDGVVLNNKPAGEAGAASSAVTVERPATSAPAHTASTGEVHSEPEPSVFKLDKTIQEEQAEQNEGQPAAGPQHATASEIPAAEQKKPGLFARLFGKKNK